MTETGKASALGKTRGGDGADMARYRRHHAACSAHRAHGVQAATRTPLSAAVEGSFSTMGIEWATSDARTHDAMRTSMVSLRLARTTGILAPSTTPAADAPNMAVSICIIIAPDSRLGRIRRPDWPAVLDSQ